MRSFVLTLSTTALLIAGGCSSSSKGNPTSTVEGKLSASSFPAAPDGVDAIDEAGVHTHVALGADGAFRLDLAKGHVYTMVVTGPKGTEPVVFPRKAGQLERTFRISSGASLVALGVVHHLDRAPQSGFSFKSTASTTPATEDNGQDGECVDGKQAGTGTPCVDDNHQATCEQGADPNANDGECVNGKDAKTGQACSDTDHVGNDGQNADASQPMAVPENNPPEDVSGCNDGADGEEAD